MAGLVGEERSSSDLKTHVYCTFFLSFFSRSHFHELAGAAACAFFESPDGELAVLLYLGNDQWHYPHFV